MSKYAKAIVALGALAVVIGRALADGTVDAAEWGSIVTAAGAAVGVWWVPNKAQA